MKAARYWNVRSSFLRGVRNLAWVGAALALATDQLDKTAFKIPLTGESCRFPALSTADKAEASEEGLRALGGLAFSGVAMHSLVPDYAVPGRIALIISEAQYETLGELLHTRSDTAAMASAFRQMGFSLFGDKVWRNLTRDRMQILIDDFARETRNLDLAVVYYSGRLVGRGKVNFLVPVEASLDSSRDLERDGVPLAELSRASAAAKFGVVFVDACWAASSNTKGNSASVLSNGPMYEAGPPHTLVSYCGPEGVASTDPNASSSPYAQELLNIIQSPMTDIRQLLMEMHEPLDGPSDAQSSEDPTLRPKPAAMFVDRLGSDVLTLGKPLSENFLLFGVDGVNYLTASSVSPPGQPVDDRSMDGLGIFGANPVSTSDIFDSERREQETCSEFQARYRMASWELERQLGLLPSEPVRDDKISVLLSVIRKSADLCGSYFDGTCMAVLGGFTYELDDHLVAKPRPENFELFQDALNEMSLAERRQVEVLIKCWLDAVTVSR